MKDPAPIDPKRSALMSRVRAKDSSPEMRVRRTAHGLGYRFRLHSRQLPGTPDLVLPGLRKVIFVNGCFWHQHPGCPRATTPKTRTEYWSRKFEANRVRDARVTSKLQAMGWEVLVIWECETFDTEQLARWLATHLGNYGA